MYPYFHEKGIADHEDQEKIASKVYGEGIRRNL
jgi:hypothetical protein